MPFPWTHVPFWLPSPQCHGGGVGLIILAVHLPRWDLMSPHRLSVKAGQGSLEQVRRPHLFHVMLTTPSFLVFTFWGLNNWGELRVMGQGSYRKTACLGKRIPEAWGAWQAPCHHFQPHTTLPASSSHVLCLGPYLILIASGTWLHYCVPSYLAS